jgi:hypothetical protein
MVNLAAADDCPSPRSCREVCTGTVPLDPIVNPNEKPFCDIVGGVSVSAAPLLSDTVQRDLSARWEAIPVASVREWFSADLRV